MPILLEAAVDCVSYQVSKNPLFCNGDVMRSPHADPNHHQKLFTLRVIHPLPRLPRLVDVRSALVSYPVYRMTEQITYDHITTGWVVGGGDKAPSHGKRTARTTYVTYDVRYSYFAVPGKSDHMTNVRPKNDFGVYASLAFEWTT